MRRSLLFLLLAALLGCDRSGPGSEEIRSTETVRKAHVYLIHLEDDGASGSKVGCGDSAVPFEVDLLRPTPALHGSLEALLSLGKRSEGAGFYNALANSPLQVERIERSENQARVYLTGYLELGGVCDDPRVLAQLQETATQFSDVETVEFYLDGQPLKDLLSGRG